MAVGLLSCPFFSSPSLDVSRFLPFSLSINLSLHNLPEYRADSEAPREREGKQANPAVRSPAKGHKSSQAPSAPVKQLEWKHTHTHSHISSDKAMAKTDQTNKTIHSHYTQILTAKCEKCLRVGCCPGFHLDQELIKWYFEAHTYCSFHCETTKKTL